MSFENIQLFLSDKVRHKLQGDAKLLIIDQEHTFIGSTNMDPRSLHLNTEIGVFIQSNELNQSLREYLKIDFHRRNAWHLQVADNGKVIWVADDIVLES